MKSNNFIIEYLQFLDDIGATPEDIKNAILFVDNFKNTKELSNYIYLGLNELGLISDIELSNIYDYDFISDGLGILPVLNPFRAVSELVKKGGEIVKQVKQGAEFVKKGIEHNIKQIANFAKTPVGKAVIGAGLVAAGLATGGALLPVIAKVGGVALKGAGIVGKLALKGGKLLWGGIKSATSTGLKGLKFLGKQALKGAKKIYNITKQLFTGTQQTQPISTQPIGIQQIQPVRTQQNLPTELLLLLPLLFI